MSKLPPLQVVPAGAGSGKTYTIETKLADWIAEGMVAPERVVAVTYTVAAAEELRERIAGRLLRIGRTEDALKLSQAYITTIHGFGLRLLTEFAFQAGSSPRPRLLNDDEREALIRRSVARTTRTDAIIASLAEHGYVFDFPDKRSPEQVFRDDLLHFIGLLRSIDATGGDRVAALAAEANQAITDLYAWVADWKNSDEEGEAAASDLTDQSEKRLGGTAMRRRLISRIEALLDEFPRCLDYLALDVKAAREGLLSDYRNMTVARSSGELDHNWQLWQKLRNLRKSTPRARLPYEYGKLAAKVRSAAGELKRHPGPLNSARERLEALLAGAQEALGHYEEDKRQAGLVDYLDMIATANRLLRNRPDVLDTLRARIDCLVVDEFQDTNPLQFSLLWKLTQAGVPTLVVGDLKQAIMGFQGADPKLFEALIQRNPEAVDPLTKNWRAQRPLMEFVNALGPVLSGDNYISLDAQRRDSPTEPLAVLSFRKRLKRADQAQVIARRVQRLIQDPSQRVADRATGVPRRLRGGDIAVLCPTHSILAAYAQALSGLGLAVRYPAEGWYQSRPVQIAVHALAFLANPEDLHAALYVAVTELGSLSLERALLQLDESGRIQDPVLERLDALSAGTADRTVYALVADTLAALGLFDVVARWSDADQARANLLRLLEEAGRFMESNREALAHGGFHGSGVQPFLAWLAERGADDDSQPEPRVLDEDAVTLRTWHSAKGLEWPVVVVCGLDRPLEPRLPNVSLKHSSFEDLSRVLEDVLVRYVPKYDEPEQHRASKCLLMGQNDLEARRLLYVAFTRARDKLVVEWPEHLDKTLKSREKRVISLTRRSEPLVNDNGELVVPQTRYFWQLLSRDCLLDELNSELVVKGVEFRCDIETIEEPTDDSQGGQASQALPLRKLTCTGRRAIEPRTPPPEELTPDSLAPSDLEVSGSDPGTARLESACYGEPLVIDASLGGRELGTHLHLCFEILGRDRSLANRLPALTGVELDPEATAAVSAAVEAFESWLQGAFAIKAVQREWPLLMLDERGSVVSGTADLLVETAEGTWVLDHKSDRIDDPAEAFGRYRAQLQAYAGILAAEGRTVLGVGIHWIRRAEVTWERLGSG